MKEVIEAIDPHHRFIYLALSRDSCIQVGAHPIKDLRVMGNRELANIVIIDNTPICFCANMDNGIYVPSYAGASDDAELMTLSTFLLEIAGVADVRPYVSRFAGIKRLYQTYCAAQMND